MRILFNRAASVCLFLMVFGAFFGLTPAANASAGNNNIKIVAWYGAGNLSKSEYGRDTIILFNPTQAAITMNEWSIQTGSTSGTFTTIYRLPSVTIPAGGFYAITGSGSGYISSSGCTATAATPAAAQHSCETTYAYDYQLKTLEDQAAVPDQTATLLTDNDLSSTAVTVALVSSTAAVGTCPIGAPTLVDMVGIEAFDGSTPVTCYAGGGPAPYTPSTLNGSTTAIHGLVYAYGTVRKNRCTDTFNNAADFGLGYIDFENQASTPKPCPTGNQLAVTAVATPSNPALSKPYVITAAVTPASVPASTGLTVTADLTTLSSTLSTTTQLYDDGTHGDAVAGDGIYTLATTAPTAVPPTKAGQVEGVTVTVTDTQGNSAISNIPLSIGASTTAIGAGTPGPGNNNIEIVAWYGAGDLSKSLYARDTIILFNPTQAPITMTNWSIQQGLAPGDTAGTYKLPTITMPAGGFYAIAGSGVSYISGSGCTSTNTVSPCAPTVDAQNNPFAYDYQLKTVEGTETATDNDLSSTAQTIALVNNQTALGSDCPIGSPHLVDLLGIGAFDGTVPVTCFAGSGYAPYVPSTINGITTNINGLVYPYATVRSNICGNTFDNAKDFELGYIAFESSKSMPHICGTGASQLAVSASATPNALGITEPFTITAKVTPATGSTGLVVTADLSNLGLSSTQPLYDDGTHGDTTPGDHIYSLATASTSGTIGAVPGLDVTATDTQGNKAQSEVALTLTPGTITLSTPKPTVTISPGGVASFTITAKAGLGYGGIMNITCLGSPNANSLGLPVATECVPNPPEVSITTNGTATFTLAISAGTTFSASPLSRSLPLSLIGLFSIGLLTIGIWRRKHLPLAALVALVALMTFNATGCGKNAGIGNTNAAPGTYTFQITATDSSVASVTNTLPLTVIVQ